MRHRFTVGLALGLVLGAVLSLSAQTTFFKLTSYYYSQTRTVTTTATIAVTDTMIEANGGASNYTITLPVVASVPTGKVYNVKQLGTGIVTLDGNASETIDGALTQTLPGQYYSFTFYKCATSAAWCIQ